MPLGERKERWKAMMATLRRNDAQAWRQGFIDTLAAPQGAP
jgi:trehalose-6-phosphate synthase